MTSTADERSPSPAAPPPEAASTGIEMYERGEGPEEAKVGEKAAPPLDIEHLAVKDDPRLWSRGRKNAILTIISITAMVGNLAANIYFPAIDALQKDLNASDNLVSASVSLFILAQGGFPTLWSGVSEIKGRKLCYIAALAFFCLGTAVCSRANSIGLFIGFRIIQGAGSSAVLSLGGGTLSDIYESEERGTKLGILAPAIAPILGSVISSQQLGRCTNVSVFSGAITSAASWRVTFYFVLGYGAVCLILMLWLPETFRKERSLAWRLAMERARAHAKEQLEKAKNALPQGEEQDLPRQGGQTKFALPPQTDDERQPMEAPATQGMTTLGRVLTAISQRSAEDKVKISLSDVNPFSVVGDIFRQKHNTITIIYSGLLFGVQYALSFTASRTFSAAPYNFNPLKVGLVGSIAGGRYSDRVFAKLKAKNGGVGEPEMRIKSTYFGLILMPPSLIVYAWVVQKHTPIYWPIIMLFPAGLANIWVYSSTLAFIVDANPGRASSAIACNSLLRGVIACIASQASGPIIDGIGNGWFYTGFSLILLGGEALLILVGVRGKQWRETYKQQEALKKLEEEEGQPTRPKKSRLPWRR
ncbi:hypothetical protein MNV49_004752 [Pseudohyphozyma bogoriensis]|nr:hypothetical protein MNV49_004752 [Pseudohyphozyma bogoriensis]